MQQTVFLVDDDSAVRESLRFLMRSVGQPLEAHASAEEFLKGFDPSRPGCLVLDVRMRGMSGLELMERLAERENCLPVIIVTGHADVPMAIQGMKLGAMDILEKPFNDQVLLDRIHAAFEENKGLLERKAARDANRVLLAHLTPREREVLDLMLEGKLNKEIARKLGISTKTLNIHRSRILEKMKVRSLPDLVRKVLLALGRDGRAG